MGGVRGEAGGGRGGKKMPDLHLVGNELFTRM